jgi:cyclohexanone monooxygenase
MKDKPLRVAIIGAGPAGIAAAIRLYQQGIDDVVLFEKNADIGGTWQVNRYPGLTCDVPAHLYRFSFAPNPEWTHRYAARAEILEYIKGMAEKHNVVEKVRLSHEVTSAEYADGRWRIHTNHGAAGSYDIVVTAVGVLHHPVYPDIPGLGDFEGYLAHSSAWNEATDIRGKRVGIIGTASTAVQIISAIVDDVKQVTLFQRTPQWILPEENPAIPEEVRSRYRSDPDYLDRRYQILSEKFMAGFGTALADPTSQAYSDIARLCRENLAQNVIDEDLRRRLTPDYEVGCKRLVVSNTFYAAIQKPTAKLVTDPIKRIETKGVRTADGTLHELDVLVTATGFDAHRYFRPMEIKGIGGLTLEDAWRNYPRTYRAICVPQFPNWFMLGGPTTPIGNFPYFKTVEHQLEYILQLVALLQSGAATAVDPKGEPTNAYNAALRVKADTSLWASGCKSWYLGKDGKVYTYPWPFSQFQAEMREPLFEDFNLA